MMRFQVCRLSEGAVSKRPPCNGAVRGSASPAWPGEFEWFIELATLEELMALLEKTGGALSLFTPEPGENFPILQVLDEEE